MKRSLIPVFLLLPLLLTFIFVGILSPTVFTACADEEYTVRFYDGETLLSETIVPVGQIVGKPASDVRPVNEGEILVWKLSSGEIAEFPFTVHADVSFYCEAQPQPTLVTYAFRYDCMDENRYEEITISFSQGEDVVDLLASPALTAIGEVTGVYDSPAFLHPAVLPVRAEEDRVFYPIFRKTVRIRFNGEEVTCPYGANLSTVLGSETHSVGSLYLDKNKQTVYCYKTAFEGLVVYGERVREKYAVTFLSEKTDESICVLFPVGHAVSEEDVPEAYRAFDLSLNGKALSLPFTPTEDVTIVCSEKKEKRYDAVVWSVVGSVLFLTVLSGVFFGKILPKIREKKEKKEESDN